MQDRASSNRCGRWRLSVMVLTVVAAAGCSQSREPGGSQKAIADGKTSSSAQQPTKSDSSLQTVPAQSAKKALPNPLERDRRTAGEQELDRLLALADASLAAVRLEAAQGLYEKCRQIRDDRKVVQKLAALGFVKQAHDSIAQARTMANNPKVLIEQAIKLETAVASFSKIDADTRHAFASISRDLQTDNQWLFGQLVDHCE